MVKKLTKQEIISYIRSTVPFSLIFLGISLIFRIIQLFENKSSSYSILFYSSLVAFIISMVIVLVMAVVNTVSRFYKNMYTNEGYLTLTLPATPTEHLVSKLIGAVLLTVFSTVVVIFGIVIATSGDVLTEIIKAASFLLKELTKFVSPANIILFVIEAVILVFAIIIKYYLLFYACTSLGQISKKSKVLASFGFYFIYYLITQAIGTAFIIIVTVFDFERIWDFFEDILIAHPIAFLHTAFAIAIVLFGILSTVYFLISRYMIKNKLNIE